MILATVDWIIISIFFVIVLGIGWWASRTAGDSTEEFFFRGQRYAMVVTGCFDGSLYLFGRYS